MTAARRWVSKWPAGAAVVLGILVAACSASTKMIRSSTTPDFQPGSVKKIFIVGVAQDKGLRQLYDDSFVGEVKKRGADAGAAYHILPNLGEVNKDVVAALLLKDGYTHVLVTRVVSIQNRETYYAPTTVSVGFGGYPGWYGGWYPYMSMSYGYVTSPGYTTVQQVVCLETNVYDLASQKMIYSGMTETWMEDSPSIHIQDVISTVSWDLRSKGVL